MRKKYIIRLSAFERQALEVLVHTGKAAAYRRTHTQILLWADGRTGREFARCRDRRAHRYA